MKLLIRHTNGTTKTYEVETKVESIVVFDGDKAVVEIGPGAVVRKPVHHKDQPVELSGNDEENPYWKDGKMIHAKKKVPFWEYFTCR